jgi:hypothetical protein
MPAVLKLPPTGGALESPENYTGYERTENFASPGGALPGKRHVYAAPAELGLNHWALSGDWMMEEQATTLNTAGGRIACRFRARDLHLVMGPAAPGTSLRFRVLIDGQPPGAAHGVDVDGHGNGTVTGQRLYQLIRQPGRVTGHTFEITFPDPRHPGLRVHLRLDRSGPCCGGVFHRAGAGRRAAGPDPDPERRGYGPGASFSDPDGNGWLLREVKQPTPGR